MAMVNPFIDLQRQLFCYKLTKTNNNTSNEI